VNDGGQAVIGNVKKEDAKVWARRDLVVPNRPGAVADDRTNERSNSAAVAKFEGDETAQRCAADYMS